VHRLTAPRPGLVVALGCFLGCTSDEWPPNERDDDADESGSSDTAEPTPAGVRIEVFEPRSPSIHYVGDTVPLIAEVRDAFELPFPYDEILWRAEGYEPTLLVGPEGDVELPPGIYDITATARMEDGDVLVATVGGVRVQTRWTGTYSGNVTMIMAAMFQGIPVAPQCTGPLTLRVEHDGETVAIGGGTCSLNALILQLEAEYTIEGTFSNGTGTGTIDYDLGGFFNLSFEWTGAFADDAFLGSFGGDTSFPLIGDIAVTGRFDAPLESPWLEELP
jgi:hypothetical protein